MRPSSAGGHLGATARVGRPVSTAVARAVGAATPGLVALEHPASDVAREGVGITTVGDLSAPIAVYATGGARCALASVVLAIALYEGGPVALGDEAAIIRLGLGRRDGGNE